MIPTGTNLAVPSPRRTWFGRTRGSIALLEPGEWHGTSRADLKYSQPVDTATTTTLMDNFKSTLPVVVLHSYIVLLVPHSKLCSQSLTLAIHLSYMVLFLFAKHNRRFWTLDHIRRSWNQRGIMYSLSQSDMWNLFICQCLPQYHEHYSNVYSVSVVFLNNFSPELLSYLMFRLGLS